MKQGRTQVGFFTNSMNLMLIVLALGSGGMLLWPRIAGGMENLTPAGAVQLINHEKAVVVDVREPDEFAAGHVRGARNIPLGQLQDKLPGAVKNKTVPLLLICATGRRSQRAAAIAKQLGYDKAQSIAGGIKAWQAANLPIEKN